MVPKVTGANDQLGIRPGPLTPSPELLPSTRLAPSFLWAQNHPFWGQGLFVHPWQPWLRKPLGGSDQRALMCLIVQEAWGHGGLEQVPKPSLRPTHILSLAASYEVVCVMDSQG